MPLGPFSTKDQLAIASLGTEFALMEVAGAAAGWWLDKKLGTLPFCLVGGVIIGFAAGLYRIIQAAKQTDTDNKNGRS